MERVPLLGCCSHLRRATARADGRGTAVLRPLVLRQADVLRHLRPLPRENHHTCARIAQTASTGSQGEDRPHTAAATSPHQGGMTGGNCGDGRDMTEEKDCHTPVATPTLRHYRPFSASPSMNACSC